MRVALRMFVSAVKNRRVVPPSRARSTLGSRHPRSRRLGLLRAEIIAVVRRPSVDTLADGSHGSYRNENDGNERT